MDKGLLECGGGRASSKGRGITSNFWVATARRGFVPISNSEPDRERERESLPTPGEAPPLHFRLYRADPSRGTQGRMVLDSIHRSGRRRSNGRRLQPPSPPRRRWLRSAPRGWTHGIVCAAAALKPPQPIKLSSWAFGSHAA